MKENYKIRNE